MDKSVSLAGVEEGIGRRWGRQRANESRSCFSRILNPLPNISFREREKISRAHVFHYFAALSLQMNELDLHEAVARNLAIISHLAKPRTELATKQRPLAFTFGPVQYHLLLNCTARGCLRLSKTLLPITDLTL